MQCRGRAQEKLTEAAKENADLSGESENVDPWGGNEKAAEPQVEEGSGWMEGKNQGGGIHRDPENDE